MICPNNHVTLLVFVYSPSCFHGYVMRHNTQLCTAALRGPWPTASLLITCFCWTTKGCFEGKASIAEIIAWWE